MARRYKPGGKRAYRKKHHMRPAYRKKRSGGRTNASVSIGRSLITSDRLFTKLRFHIDLGYSGSTNASYTFRGNSLFDPYVNGVGTQPTGFDEYSAFYARYRVYASKMTIIVVNNSSTVQTHSALLPSLSASVPTATDATEATYSKWWINPIIGTAQPKKVSNYITTRKIHSGKKGVVALDDTYGAATTADPTAVWFWHWTMESLDGVTNNTGRVFVVIDYFCEFYNRKDLSQS